MNGYNRSPQYFAGSPARHQYAARQALHLHPQSPYMSPRPRGTWSPSPRNNFRSPNFIPVGSSSPVDVARRSWTSPNCSSPNSSYTSTSSTPPNSRRNSFRGNFHRGRGKFNNSGSGSPHISQYVSKDMFEDPWAELEEKLKTSQNCDYLQAVGSYDDKKEQYSTDPSDPESSGKDDKL